MGLPQPSFRMASVGPRLTNKKCEIDFTPAHVSQPVCPCSVSSCLWTQCCCHPLCHRQTGRSSTPTQPQGPALCRAWKPSASGQDGLSKLRSIDVACLTHLLSQPLAPPGPIYSSGTDCRGSGGGLEAGTALGELFEISPHPIRSTAPNAGLENKSEKGPQQK